MSGDSCRTDGGECPPGGDAVVVWWLNLLPLHTQTSAQPVWNHFIRLRPNSEPFRADLRDEISRPLRLLNHKDELSVWFFFFFFPCQPIFTVKQGSQAHTDQGSLLSLTWISASFRVKSFVSMQHFWKLTFFVKNVSDSFIIRLSHVSHWVTTHSLFVYFIYFFICVCNVIHYIWGNKQGSTALSVHHDCWCRGFMVTLLSELKWSCCAPYSSSKADKTF